MCGLRGACYTSTTMTMFSVGSCVFYLFLCGRVACGTVCDPCPPPPVSLSTAQQHVYLFVFVEVERRVCGHRGACYTSPTMFLVGSCVSMFCEGGGGGELVAPRVT